MSVIYEPRGKAKEYSELALNIYRGCSHGCTYCYAPSAIRCDKTLFHDKPEPRKNIISQINKDAEKFAGDKRPVLLCFTSDAYQPLEKELRLTQKAITSLSLNGLTPQILTKAGTWAVKRDINILKKSKAIWAATLTTDDPVESISWEPTAALPEDRINALKFAKKNGLRTWISFEPVLNPDAVYRLIEKTHEFVDLYKVGKLNYHPLAKQIDWKDFLVKTEKCLDHYSKDRYIKKDLETYRHNTAP